MIFTYESFLLLTFWATKTFASIECREDADCPPEKPICFGIVNRYGGCYRTESCKWEQLEKVANDEGLGLLEGTVNNLEECHAECRRTSGCFSVRYCKEPNRADSCYLYDKEITEKDKLNQKEIANCFTSFLKCSVSPSKVPCEDGEMNGDEEGIDCGGSCPNPCGNTCEDGEMNGDEEGIDCGGSCPNPCGNSCEDGEMNGDEEGIDCGGSCPNPCVSTPPPEDGSKFCPDGFKELDKATTDDIGDICRNQIRHNCNVGWTCPGDCVAICNREPYCKMPWSAKPCRVKDLEEEVSSDTLSTTRDALDSLTTALSETTKLRNGNESTKATKIKETTKTTTIKFPLPQHPIVETSVANIIQIQIQFFILLAIPFGI